MWMHTFMRAHISVGTHLFRHGPHWGTQIWRHTVMEAHRSRGTLLWRHTVMEAHSYEGTQL